MQLRTFIKKLQEVEKKHPRAPIMVEWKTCKSDDYTHSPIIDICTDYLPISDGDGFTVINKDGSEHHTIIVTLKG